jgi:hypothetical protein
MRTREAARSRAGEAAARDTENKRSLARAILASRVGRARMLNARDQRRLRSRVPRGLRWNCLLGDDAVVLLKTRAEAFVKVEHALLSGRHFIGELLHLRLKRHRGLALPALFFFQLVSL